MTYFREKNPYMGRILTRILKIANLFSRQSVLRIRIRILFGQLGDPDPHWEYGSGSALTKNAASGSPMRIRNTAKNKLYLKLSYWPVLYLPVWLAGEELLGEPVAAGPHLLQLRVLPFVHSHRPAQRIF